MARTKRCRMAIALLLWPVVAIGSQFVLAWLARGWSLGFRLLGAVVVGLIVGVALGFATAPLLRQPTDGPAQPRYSLDDDEIGPDHPLYPILMGTMEKGAVSFEAADTPDGIDIRNVRYRDEDDK